MTTNASSLTAPGKNKRYQILVGAIQRQVP